MMWDDVEDYEPDEQDDEDTTMGDVESEIMHESRVRLAEADRALRHRPNLKDAEWWVG